MPLAVRDRTPVHAPVNEPTDEDVIENYYAGNEPAFTELSNRWFPRFVRGYCRHGVEVHTAEDLAVDTLLRIARTREKGSKYLRNKRPFAGWAWTIARNILRDHLRRIGRQEVHVDMLTDLPAPGESLPTAEILHPADLEGPLAECLRGLPKEVQTTILMSLNQSGTEIAEALGSSNATVSRRLTDGFAALVAGLRQRGVRVVPAHSELPDGTTILAHYLQEVVILLPSDLSSKGYRLSRDVKDLQVGDRIVLAFREEGEVVVQRPSPTSEEAKR